MAELEIVSGEPSPRGGCVHHWVLGNPVAGRIIGRCRGCRATKSFPASPESAQRFDDYRELTAATAYTERLSA